MAGSGKVIGAIAGLLFLQACTTTHIFVVQEPVRSGSAEPASADSFGGAIEKTTDVECASNTMVEVRVQRDWLNSLVGALTLGFYQKTSIEYICGKAPDDDVPTLGGADAGGDG